MLSAKTPAIMEEVAFESVSLTGARPCAVRRGRLPCTPRDPTVGWSGSLAGPLAKTLRINHFGVSRAPPNPLVRAGARGGAAHELHPRFSRHPMGGFFYGARLSLPGMRGCSTS